MRVHFFVALGCTAALLLAAPDVAYARSEVLDQTCKIAETIWLWIRGAVYILAGISLAMMSFQASIMGRFSMARLGVWGGSLFVLSAVPALLGFLMSGTTNLAC